MSVQRNIAEKFILLALLISASLPLGCGSGPVSSLKLISPGGVLLVNSPNQVRAILVGQDDHPQDVTDSATWSVSGGSASISKGILTCSQPGKLSVHASLERLEASGIVTCAGQNAASTPVPPQDPTTVTQNPSPSSPQNPSPPNGVSSPPTTPQEPPNPPGGGPQSPPTNDPTPSGTGPESNPDNPVTSGPKPAVIAIAFESAPETVRSEAPFQFRMLANNSDGISSDQTANATWSTNADIAYVSPTGLVSCNLPGTVTVTAKLEGLTASTSFTCVLRRVTPMAGFAEGAQKFDGPFASWVNVKTVFGAKGDGINDDTQALQAALDSIHNQTSVLWLPKGTYIISNTLRLRAAERFSIIGEDPRATILEWHGSAGGTMLSLEGCTWFRLARLWWDGKDIAGVAIHISSTLSDGENYPTYDDVEDQKISHVGKGLQIGFAGETTVQRVYFDHNSIAGISLEDWDALNFNVVDSLFVDCAIGVTNFYGSGAFNVSNSAFVRSTTADMMMGNTGPFSERQNLSFDSTAFFVAVGAGAGANIILQANTIVHPSQTPIQIANPGPITVLDNQFLKMDSSLNIFRALGSNPVGVFSMGNQFTVPTPYYGNLGKFVSIDEASYSSDQESAPPIPLDVYTPSPSNRQIIEIPRGARSSAIQAAIDSAAQLPDAVVHFVGGYSIDQTIVVSGSNHLVLAGDGPTTVLGGTSHLNGAVLQVRGNNVELQNFWIDAPAAQGQSTDLELDVDDIPSTEIHCDQCKSFFSPVAFQARGLDHALFDFRVAVMNAVGQGASISGGATRQAGGRTLGRIDGFMTCIDSYSVDQSGHFLVEDGWHDAGQGAHQFDLTGSVEVTHQGGTILTQNSVAAMNANQLSGKVSLLGVATDSRLSINTSNPAKVGIVGTLQVTGDQIIAEQPVSGKFTQQVNLASKNNNTPTPLPDSVATPGDVEATFGQTRTEYVAPRLERTISGSSRIVLHRVLFGSAKFGLVLMPKNSLQSSYYSISSLSSDHSSTEGGNCPVGTQSMSGNWQLEAASDGFFGLKNNGLFLSSDGQESELSFSPVLAHAGERWSTFPVGDGTFEIVNRANGKVLTRDTIGCAHLDREKSSEDQHWHIEPLY